MYLGTPKKKLHVEFCGNLLKGAKVIEPCQIRRGRKWIARSQPLRKDKKLISLMYNILWSGYLRFKLKSIYYRQGSKIENQSQKYKQNAEIL